MKRDNAPAQTIDRLTELEREYDLTVRVLAVLVERIQQLTGVSEIQIPDAAVIDQPDLTAWRPARSGFISLMAAR